jgi:hypothetical protein
MTKKKINGYLSVLLNMMRLYFAKNIDTGKMKRLFPLFVPGAAKNVVSREFLSFVKCVRFNDF